jgi:transcription elongation factor GreA
MVLLTKEGFKKIQDELQERKVTIRQEIALAIKEAKEQGDLSENAEYSSARQRQSENESRIAELEVILKDAEVAKKGKSNGHIQMGSSIVVKTKSNEMKFEIVGTNEADPALGKISNESPMGKAFMGQMKGETVEVETPAGKMKFDILDVK